MILMTQFETGGAEKVALELTRRLGRDGHAIHLASVYAGGALRRQAAALGATVHEGLAANRFDLRCVWRLRQRIVGLGIDVLVILDATRAAMLCGVYGAMLAGRPCRRVLWLHACPGHNASDRLPNFIPRLKAMTPLLDRIVPVARWVGRYLVGEGIPDGKIEVIPNGIDPQRYATGLTVEDARRRLGLPLDARLALQVGNRWPERDPHWLLEAFAQTVRTAPDAHLVLVGRGMADPDVGQTCRRLGLADRVHLPGPVCDVPVYLRAADAFVLATRHETHSIAALEALAAGLPLVVTDIPAFADVLRHDHDCLKVAPGDAEALGRSLAAVLDDPLLAGRLAAAGPRTAARYTLDAMAQRFYDLLSVYSREADRD